MFEVFDVWMFVPVDNRPYWFSLKEHNNPHYKDTQDAFGMTDTDKALFRCLVLILFWESNSTIWVFSYVV
jgi:hypothetical protein